MRQTIVSNCERDFLLQTFIEDSRLDGRSCAEYRSLKITLGLERGSCFVELGSTKVFAQVSTEIVAPKAARPSSGEIFVNVEMSPMAAPNFEAGRLGERGIEITRLLERVLKESSCVDVESLCIIAGEKVWRIRIDIHVIDHDGAIVDCASVAAICALKSFRRPDVTLIGESFVLHTIEDKEPVPLNLFHVPVCMTFGLTEQGTCVTVDPTELEEQVLDEEIVIAMNSHKELCTIHCTGGTLLQKQQILRCCSMATQRAKEITDMINDVFQKDTIDRSKKQKIGFSSLVSANKITSSSYVFPSTSRQLTNEVLPQSGETMSNDVNELLNSTNVPHVRRKGKVFQIGEHSPPLMTQSDSDEDVAILAEIRDVKKSAIRSSNVENIENKRNTERKNRGKNRKEKDNKDVLQLLKGMEEDVVVLSSEPKKEEDDDEEEIKIVEEFNLSAALKKQGGKQKKQKLK